MPKSVRIAVVQMEASPLPVKERLTKAGGFISKCVDNGARLVVLPEVFNTGYEYDDRNYLQAEPIEGPTVSWMRKTAARYHIYLAGSFLRRERNEIFNTLLLAAPDNHQWHYDKNYPWVWERAYFQNGTDIMIADTDLGKIGFLICWDVAHPNLWKKYAGKIDLMIVSSCPPKALDLALILPDGQRIMAKDTGSLIPYLKRTADRTFGEYLRRQAGFLRVPVAHSTGTGTFRSAIPNPKFSVVMLSVIYPPLLRKKSQIGHALIETGYFSETYLADSSGNILSSVQPDTEGFAISDVILPDAHPVPKGKQPSFGISNFTYLLDALANIFLTSEYKRKTKRYLSKQVSNTKNDNWKKTF